MKCNRKRTVFDLLSVYTCEGCKHQRKDELIVIGNQVIAIYYLSDNCPHLSTDNDYLVLESKKLSLLFKDAIIYNKQIMFFFFEEFKLEKHYELFEKIMDDGLSIQVISMK
ncbi:MAG: hypothetical protein PHV87_07740 [Bacilli bacterium]|nr:hypothetical protein [Bacilli bacterium]